MNAAFIVRCGCGERVRVKLDGSVSCPACGTLIEGKRGRGSNSYEEELMGLVIPPDPWGD